MESIDVKPFNCELKNTKQFAELLDLLDSVSEDDSVTVSITSDGISCKQIAQDKTRFCDVLLSSSAFTQSDCPSPLGISINCKMLSKWIRATAIENESLLIHADNKTFDLRKTNGYSRELSTKVGAIIRKPAKANLPEFPVHFKMNAEKLSGLIKELEIIKEVISISATKDGLALSSASERGSAKIALAWTLQPDLSLEGEVKSDVKSSYDPDMFTQVMKVIFPLCPQIELLFGNNLPLLIKGSGEYLTVQYVLAAKVATATPV